MDLLTACRLGGSGLDGTFVRSLLAGGADVNLRDDTAWTAMMWCTRNGAVEEVDVQGQSALLWACLRNRPKAVRALLQLGARVDAADPKGRTGLMVAAELGAFECQERLLAGGAAVNAQTRAPCCFALGRT